MSTEVATPSGEAVQERARRRLPVSPEFLKFITVGAVAFVINEITLYLFYDLLPLLPEHDTEFSIGPVTHPDVSLLIASVFAVETAIVFKFFAHEHWTFPHRRKPEWVVLRFLKFNASSILSPIISVTTVNILTPLLGISPYIALAIGVAFSFLVNWFFSAYLIWPSRDVENETARS